MARCMRILPTMALCLMVSLPAWADATGTYYAAGAPTRQAYVNDVVQRVLNIVQDPAQPHSQKKSLLEREFVRTVDTRWIAEHVAGEAWKQASTQEQNAYAQLYTHYLIQTYMAGIDEQTEKNLRDIRVLGIDSEYEDAFVVRTEMVMREGKNVHVHFVVQEHGAERKIIDVVLNGVSMLHTHREELGTLARTQGMPVVIAKLQDLIARKQTLAFSSVH